MTTDRITLFYHVLCALLYIWRSARLESVADEKQILCMRNCASISGSVALGWLVVEMVGEKVGLLMQ